MALVVFLVGLHRRNMRAIGQIGKLERIFGGPVTTRSWSTVLAIASVLRGSAARRRDRSG